MKIKKILAGFMLGMILTVSPAFAKPEHIALKSEQMKGREAQAKALAKSVDLARVADPEARVALRAIFKTLDLQDKSER